jgi:2-hydroxychromene-2-carboxylate isomerase
MNFPSPHHPLKSVQAMRFCCVLEPDQPALARFAQRAFEAYFTEARNLDAVDVLIEVADECGLPGTEMERLSRADEARLRLRSNTQEVIDRGGFGSPTMFVDRTQLYFGNDQLPIVRLALKEKVAAAE